MCLKKDKEKYEFLSQVKEILKKNDTITDLSRFDINVRLLEIVKENLTIYPNIGIIKWKERKSNEEYKPQLENIEKQLNINNEEFRRYPSDFVHCLLANLTYIQTSNLERNESTKNQTSKVKHIIEICIEAKLITRGNIFPDNIQN